jgi:hypothetical protein
MQLDGWNSRIIKMATHFTDGGKNVTVSGWGYIDNHSTVPNQLQRATKKSLSNDECKRMISPWTDFVTESKICTLAIRNTLGKFLLLT